MVYPATDLIYQTMQEHKLDCGIEAREDASVLHIHIHSEKTTFEVLYISRSDENDVAMRIYNLLRFPEEKLPEMLETVNECNLKYRFLKFSVDSHSNAVNAAFDFTIAAENLGESAHELLVRSAGVIDACYPLFMSRLVG